MDCGFETTLALKAKWRPDGDTLAVCRQHGRDIARQWALSPSALTVSAPAVTAVQPASEPEVSCADADLGPRMQCSVCLWIYDPALGEPMQDVAPGTCWQEVPDDFLCPECAMGKEVFDPLSSEAK
ncbi:Anaerobic nitric oxide reductase flavorubredoxin [compost metagenome]